MAFYRRIRELREDNDKTQKEIAEYLGTPYQYYAVYEKGGSEISFERAIMLAKYYNVSLDYIAGLTNEKHGAVSTTELEKKIICAVSELSPRAQRSLLDFINELTDRK